MVLKQEEVLYRRGYDIGIGVSMSTGSPLALGTTGEVTPPQIGTGGSGLFRFNRIQTTEELESSLGISADLSGGIGLFNASDTFNFSQNCKIHSNCIATIITATEEFAFQQMDSPSLSPAAAMLVENGQPLDQQFGEYFIRGIQTGGRFIGILRIETRSTQARMDLDNELSGSYGVTISAEVKLKISEVLKRTNAKAEVFIYFEGGSIKTRPQSDDPIELTQQLYQAMDEWAATVRNEPKPYKVTLAPYFVALGPTPPNTAEIEKQRDVLIRCAKLRSQTLDKLNLIDYILDPNHTDEFTILPDGPDLPMLQAALSKDLDAIARAASHAINNIKDARNVEEYMRTIENEQDFTMTQLPPNLPKHESGILIDVTPKVEVPNLVGKPAVVAQPLLLRAGLVPEILIDESVEPGFVASQDPPAGTKVSPGSKVRVIRGKDTSGGIKKLGKA